MSIQFVLILRYSAKFLFFAMISIDKDKNMKKKLYRHFFKSRMTRTKISLLAASFIGIVHCNFKMLISLLGCSHLIFIFYGGSCVNA